MARASLVLLSAAVIAGFTATPAHAEPAPPCAFTLSPPAVVHVDGADMVSVTVSPDACGAPANPASAWPACNVRTTLRPFNATRAGEPNQRRCGRPTDPERPTCPPAGHAADGWASRRSPRSARCSARSRRRCSHASLSVHLCNPCQSPVRGRLVRRTGTTEEGDA